MGTFLALPLVAIIRIKIRPENQKNKLLLLANRRRNSGGGQQGIGGKRPSFH
jgi:hypothetical protein